MARNKNYLAYLVPLLIATKSFIMKDLVENKIRAI
jgi:hypothetical protein